MKNFWMAGAKRDVKWAFSVISNQYCWPFCDRFCGAFLTCTCITIFDIMINIDRVCWISWIWNLPKNVYLQNSMLYTYIDGGSLFVCVSVYPKHMCESTGKVYSNQINCCWLTCEDSYGESHLHIFNYLYQCHFRKLISSFRKIF